MEIKWVNWQELPDGILKSYSALFAENKVSDLIKNVQTEYKILQVTENLFFPVSINDTEWNSSYVCSPYTAYVLYAQEELQRKIPNKWLQFPLLGLIKGISYLLRWANINKNVHINNYLLSTNPYPDWDGENITKITTFIQKQYPNHAIIFRSLNDMQHQTLLQAFQTNDYELIASRQVYMYTQNKESWWKHNNNKQDRRLMKNRKLIYLNHEEMGDYLQESLLLYQKLYLEKYSMHNPQFTLRYFQSLHQSKSLIFQGYKDENNVLKSFSGLFIIEDTITSPLVGYDTDAPSKEALYIHAIQSIYDYKFQSGKMLNLSSGASLFKRLRGGKAAIEYSALYIAHLDFRRRSVIKILQFVSNKIGVPLMKKYEL